MKKLFVFTAALLLLYAVSYGQIDSSRFHATPLSLQEKLLHRSKTQNNTAWVLLGAGLAVDALSFAFRPKDSESFTSGIDKAIVSAGLFVVGTAAVISSIPIFIVAGANRRKAALLVQARKLELAPGIRTSEWQVGTGISLHF